ncbi:MULTISPECIES: ABATE domain-containing protein [unclassified Afipia]|nr:MULTISPECIES: ABATE domain-containing protein [unclassified Afipia]
MTQQIFDPSEPVLPHVAADHPVLDMLNTLAQIDGKAVDSWASDADVRDWLVRTGGYGEGELPPAMPGLLTSARRLRETVRALVVDRKGGGAIDPSPLNDLLAKSPGHSELVCDEPGLRLTRRRTLKTPDQVLGPVAEAAAELLATGDFNLIRKCEDRTCVMWFYDRTKSHRRRWCSMALCGNRNKVAAFRQRRQG